MKTKKFLILSILMITMLVTGCSYTAEENKIKEIQQVAEDFLTTKGYEAPREYYIEYVKGNKENLYVYKDEVGITFDISEKNKYQIISANVSGREISETQISEFTKVKNEFLNTEGYEIPEGYNINYKNENKELQIKKGSIAITFNISDDAIVKLYYKDYEKEVYLIFMGILFIIIIIVSVVEIKNYKENE